MWIDACTYVRVVCRDVCLYVCVVCLWICVYKYEYVGVLTCELLWFQFFVWYMYVCVRVCLYGYVYICTCSLCRGMCIYLSVNI